MWYPPGEREISNDSAVLKNLFMFTLPHTGLQTRVKAGGGSGAAMAARLCAGAGLCCLSLPRAAGRGRRRYPDLPLARHSFQVFPAPRVGCCSFPPTRSPAAMVCVAREQRSPVSALPPHKLGGGWRSRAAKQGRCYEMLLPGRTVRPSIPFFPGRFCVLN